MIETFTTINYSVELTRYAEEDVEEVISDKEHAAFYAILKRLDIYGAEAKYNISKVLEEYTEEDGREFLIIKSKGVAVVFKVIDGCIIVHLVASDSGNNLVKEVLKRKNLLAGYRKKKKVNIHF